MIHPSDFEKKLGFDQIRERIRTYCLGEPAQMLVSKMVFGSTFERVEGLLRRCMDMKRIFEKGEDLPVRPYHNPLSWFETAATEGNFLEPEDFLQLGRALKIIQEILAFFSYHKEAYPALAQMMDGVVFGNVVPRLIQASIDEEGKLKDQASPALSRIRRSLREEERKVRKVADQIMMQALAQGWTAPGSNPTIRDGRLVIPVNAEHRRKIKGYIIDESSTGQTVFVEPGELLEANNDLREWELEEKKETIRILRDMTAIVRLHLPELETNLGFLAELDFVRAKTRFAQDIDGDMPQLKNIPHLQWKDAKHPLLLLSLKGKRALVPLTIHLDSENRLLLVSGPNAGGKSVCLKTVGLLQYMVQCGLLVPMHPDSTVGIFDEIFLDMGDQQSIENDLSTYSSHLRNMDLFIRKSGEHSLVLMDELGSGTDPNFGGGIAQAVLEQLVKKCVWGLATTHYYNLKVFASNTPGIRNAAMLFDSQHLSPLFRLEIGQPGSSFALEIARKTGLPPDTIKSAEEIIGEGLTGLDTLMQQLTQDKQLLEEKRKAMEEKEAALSGALRHYELLSGNLESEKKEILNRAKAEASVLLQTTNREIEKTIRHIRENKAEKKETRKVRQDLKDLQSKVKPVSGTVKVSSPLLVGDKVRIVGGDVTGTVLSVKGKTATVQFGDLRSTVSMDRLVRSDSLQATAKNSKPLIQGIELHQRQSAFSSQLDVRGKRVEELLPLLVRFMDDAVLLGQQEVKILHGKGEGVLRGVVREYLKKLKSVASVRDEHVDRGGDGMTLVQLK